MPDDRHRSPGVRLVFLRRIDPQVAYERVLVDALDGDATLYAREDFVEEAWRIVDPVLKSGTPLCEYEPQT